MNIRALALRLHQARLDARELAPLTEEFRDLTLDDAYGIQETGIGLRQKADEKIIGYKMGLTSKAKREQMKLDAPVYGVLTDRMQIDDGGSYSLKGTIHPKIEPEIAFIAAKELSGQVSVEDVFAAIDGVCAALEILDSRYKGFQYFSLPDVVADNSSSSMFIIGKPVKNFRSLDLARLAMRFQVNGELAHEAQSSAISGNPLLSVVALCELLAKRKQSIPKGSLILAGAATAAVSLEAGMKVELHVDGLPGVSVSMAL